MGGGKFINWYVTAILFLYLFFPLLYKYVEKAKTFAYLLVVILSILLLSNCSFEWRYDCFISRLPSFIFGISLYHSKGDKQKIGSLLFVSFAFWIYAYTHDLSHFLISALIAPLLLPFICTWSSFNNKTTNVVKSVLAWCGKYSYEIYISNAFTCSAVTKIPNISTPILIIGYIGFSILFGFFFIILSKKILRKDL